MGKRRKGVPFNPFNPTEVAKRKSEKRKEHEELTRKIEERKKLNQETEAKVAEIRKIERESREKKERLAEIKREKERIERENKRYRSPSLEPDFYIDLSQKKITNLSQYEKLIILSIYGLRENPEEYNNLGLLINYLQANFKNEEEKKKELENYIRSKDTWNTNYIKDVENSSSTRTLEEKLSSLEGFVEYHSVNCPLEYDTCQACDLLSEAINFN